MTEWKPGDVALVKVDGHEGAVLGLRDTVGWATNRTNRQRSHAHWTNAEYVTPVRPLVVIDPEDREAVARLVARYFSIYDGMDAVPSAGEIASMQTALREFANPPPPIEEPTGKWAVVIADGAAHVRAAWATDRPWSRIGTDRFDAWAEMDVESIEFEGVQA